MATYMRPTMLMIALLSIFFTTAAQNSIPGLADVRTISQAEEFMVKYPALQGKIFTVESGKDTSELIAPLYSKQNGFTFSMDNYTFKVLQVDSTLSFRARYIYLNGGHFSKAQIDSLRSLILSKYKNGANFIELVQEYNMDGNMTGDTQWFTENQMVPSFETAVRQHKKGDIFTVDTPGMNWYHVVLKTFDDSFIKQLSLLRLQRNEL
ncbi:MAG: hypothetical protein EOO06_07510 [Chitinophagaceae bacterium]|nr:MAG: hypothetical protein EOO06_07510 [Chitinophagaceae bacterium]